MKPWHEYTSAGLNELAEDAINQAFLHIHDRMEIATGDAAGIFCSGPEYDQVKKFLIDYMKFEINLQGESK